MPDPAFHHMTMNAMHFLRLATGDYANRPEQMAIRVYTAVELILKARLLHEHWTLIVTRNPDRAKFEKGDFVSVPFDKACNRLRDALREPIANAAREAFDELRKARNVIVHFASQRWHRSTDQWQHDRETRGLTRRACVALHDIMRGQWSEIFSPYFGELDAVEEIMNRIYRTAPAH